MKRVRVFAHPRVVEELKGCGRVDELVARAIERTGTRLGNLKRGCCGFVQVLQHRHGLSILFCLRNGTQN